MRNGATVFNPLVSFRCRRPRQIGEGLWVQMAPKLADRRAPREAGPAEGPAALRCASSSLPSAGCDRELAVKTRECRHGPHRAMCTGSSCSAWAPCGETHVRLTRDVEAGLAGPGPRAGVLGVSAKWGPGPSRVPPHHCQRPSGRTSHLTTN